MTNQRNKVFCIGFHKTGTTSLKQALAMLRYRVTGPNGVMDPNIAENVYTMADSLVGHYDAFQDNPWPMIYRYCDRAYPESRFILTVRDSPSWIASQVNHFGEGDTPMRRWIYGAGDPKGDEQIYIDRYECHNAEVKEYFRERERDLLILNLVQGDGWEQLCPFLGVNVPDAPFPSANRAVDRLVPVTPGERLMRALNRVAGRARRKVG